MATFALWLKLGAIVFSGPLLLYGLFVGVIGIGPDGVVPWNLRMEGILWFITGLVYLIPNSLVVKDKWITIACIAATLIPAIVTFVIMTVAYRGEGAGNNPLLILAFIYGTALAPIPVIIERFCER